MDLFLPAEQRREILKQYGAEHDLNAFIETGTNNGDTPWALKDCFKRLYTIELDDLLWDVARQRFRYVPQVTCLRGDSTVVLLEVLAMLTEPALVWLDGHYCGPGTAHARLSTPVEEELTILLSDVRRHVILIDDARIFEGGPEHDLYPHYADYPSLAWVEEIATASGYTYRLEDDIIRLTPGMP